MLTAEPEFGRRGVFNIDYRRYHYFFCRGVQPMCLYLADGVPVDDTLM